MGVVALARAAPPLVLALDVGSSSARAQVYDAHARAVEGAGAQASYPLHLTADGAAEVPPDLLVEQVAALLDAVLQAAQAARDAVAGVALSTFWHSLLGVDAAGRPLTPLLLWSDQRAGAAAVALQHELNEAAVHARTGCRLHPSYWPARLRWLAAAQPARFARVRRWLGFGEYLGLRLFGEARASLSMASATGLLDQHTRAWDPALLATVGVSSAHLPPIADAPCERLPPPWAARWPALARVPWWPAWGDGACSNVGCGALGPTRRALMIGTSGALRAAWTAADVTIPPGVWAYRVDPRRVVLGGALNDGGNLLAWLRATLGLGSADDWLDDTVEAEIAALPADGHGLTVLPLWGGERSPGWAPHARGAIVGLSLATRPAEIVRATLEAIALRFALLDALLAPAVAAASQATHAAGASPRQASAPVDSAAPAAVSRDAPAATASLGAAAVEVIATGGALLRFPAWLQIVADALGRPVTASAEPEASSRGAALLALERLGAIPAAEAVPAALGAVYQPDPANHARYQAALARQQTLYRLLVEEHGALFLDPPAADKG